MSNENKENIPLENKNQTENTTLNNDISKTENNKLKSQDSNNVQNNNSIKTNIITNKLEESTKVVLKEIEEKERIIEQRKKKFKIFSITLLVISLISVIIFGALAYSNYITEKNKERKITTPEPEQTTILDISDVFVLYNNDELMLNVRYPENVVVTENKTYNGDVRNIEITYSPNNGFDENNELTEGFIVRVTPLQLARESIEKIAEVKRESFYQECGTNSQISNIRSDVIDNNLAKSFDVRNCNGDFKVSYTSKFGVYYEIIQLFRGNLGFIQQYRITTEDIVSTLSFYAEKPIEQDPFKIYESRDLSFYYPQDLTVNCCSIPEVSTNGKLIINIGTKDFQDRIGGLSVFSVSKNEYRSRNMEFIDFYNEQKELLISDYKIVNNGIEPVYSEEEIKVGDRTAFRLRGISWKNNDVIFIEDTQRSGQNYYTISVLNEIGPDFEETIKEILESFEFTN